MRFDTLRASTDLFSWSKVKGHLRSSEVSDLAWPLTDRDLIWIHICAKWMSNSKSARKTTLESPKKQKRSPEVTRGHWPHLTSEWSWPHWKPWRSHSFTCFHVPNHRKPRNARFMSVDSPRIAIFAWHDLENDVTGHGSLRSGSRNFQSRCKID